MVFSFGASSTAAAGAPSTPGFGFGAATGGATGFGAQPQSSGSSLFGASSTRSFGASSSASLFGASSTPQFGASTGFSLGGGMGAASSPSLFGQQTGGFGSSGAGAVMPFTGASTGSSLFGPSSTQSFFGKSPGGFGSTPPQPQGANYGMSQQLMTKDNRPIAHSTKWEDLSPQAQQYLLQLEKVVSTCAHECKQLEDQNQFQPGEDATCHIDEQAKVISQNISALSIREKMDDNELENIRESVVHLVRHTEAAVYSFKRSLAWRNMTKNANASHSLEELGPPMALPYPFLLETIENFESKLKAQMSAVNELEVTVKNKGQSRKDSRHSHPETTLDALSTAISNLHDCLMRVAAKIQELDDKVTASKSRALQEMQQGRGTREDPFKDASEKEQAYRTSRREDTLKNYEDIYGNVPDRQTVPSAVTAAQPYATTGLFGTAAPGAGLFGQKS